jgi:hypothetical protein
MLKRENETATEVVGIRELVEKVTADIQSVEQHASSGQRVFLARLGSHWKELRSTLALGRVPDRVCPRCGRLGMHEATLCGHCWKRLMPDRSKVPQSGGLTSTLQRLEDDGGPS